MQTRMLGSLAVSALGLGCMGMSRTYGRASRWQSRRTLHRALDLGITLLDTANSYGQGGNEELIGRVLGKRRHAFLIATKFGQTFVAGRKSGIDGHPHQVALRCEESLRRLRTDVIDLYYLHRLDKKVPIEDTVGAMAQLVAAGKVRHLGLSEVSAATLRRAHAEHPITAVQSEYSLWTRDPEAQVLPACRELGIGFVPFSPLGRGMLTGTITPAHSILAGRDVRNNMPRFQGSNLTSNVSLIEALGHIAQENQCTRSQLALAWLLAQGDTIVPIPGTKRVSYLEENVAAIQIELRKEQITRIDRLFMPANIAGERFAPGGMASLDRDPG